MVSAEARYAEAKYQGEVADKYVEKRRTKNKWWAEHRHIIPLLSDLPQGTSVLDVPVGTGRFIPLYEFLGFHVHGWDINADMLKEAAKVVRGENVYLRRGNALALDAPDQSYDVAVCIRLFRWLSKDEVVRVIKELQRVAKRRVIFNARTDHNHPYARSFDLITSAIEFPWRMMRSSEIEPGYTMFMLERA